ncbi:MAG TPA: universal stress protein, partial [Candidatus Obscuribacterales bacterium]
MYQRILVALGEEDTINQPVLAEAIAIAHTSHGTLNLLHVLAPPSTGFPDPLYLTADGMYSTINTDSFQLYLGTWQTAQKANQEVLEAQANDLLAQ